MRRVIDSMGQVTPCYTMSWQFTWDCICIELGIEEF